METLQPSKLLTQNGRGIVRDDPVRHARLKLDFAVSGIVSSDTNIACEIYQI